VTGTRAVLKQLRNKNRSMEQKLNKLKFKSKRHNLEEVGFKPVGESLAANQQQYSQLPAVKTQSFRKKLNLTQLSVPIDLIPFTPQHRSRHHLESSISRNPLPSQTSKRTMQTSETVYEKGEQYDRVK
jgi:hypothetical protein